MNDRLPAPHEIRKALQALLDDRQNARILKLSFPRKNGPDDALMVINRLDAFEGMNRDFEYKLEVLSDTPRPRAKKIDAQDADG